MKSSIPAAAGAPEGSGRLRTLLVVDRIRSIAAIAVLPGILDPRRECRRTLNEVVSKSDLLRRRIGGGSLWRPEGKVRLDYAVA